jgi:hypothetical protein
MEGPFDQESSSEIRISEVLEALRTHGLAHEATRELVVRWTEQEERRIEEEPRNKRLPVVFNIQRADLYLIIGDVEGAIECLKDALVQAQGEGFEDLYQQAEMLLHTNERSN